MQDAEPVLGGPSRTRRRRDTASWPEAVVEGARAPCPGGRGSSRAPRCPASRSMWRRSATRSSGVRCLLGSSGASGAPAGPAVCVAIVLVVLASGTRAGSPHPPLASARGRGLRRGADLSLLARGYPKARSRDPLRTSLPAGWPSLRSAAVARAPEVAAAGRDAVAGLRRCPRRRHRAARRAADRRRRAPEPVGASCSPASPTCSSSRCWRPLAGLWWRRRRPSLPRLVADDRAGTVLLGALTVLLVVLGARPPARRWRARATTPLRSRWPSAAWVASAGRRAVPAGDVGRRRPPGSTGRASTAPASRDPRPAARCACSSPPTSRRRPSSATPTSARRVVAGRTTPAARSAERGPS